MRNGNIDYFNSNEAIIGRVCSLPMRNGNWRYMRGGRTIRSRKFVAYLWGMETLSFLLFAAGIASVCSLPMRNGNLRYGDKGKAVKDAFVAYLWGMETKCRKHPRSAQVLFVAYLWGMETNIIRRKQLEQLEFVAYLWGMETGRITRFSTWAVCVCSLPMRNGNKLT